jgi:hypothetical protein
MFLKSNIFRFILVFCLIISVSVVALADTIRLKDGSVIKGKIISFREGQFTVQIGDGTRSRQMTFFADEIETIEFDSGSTSNTARNTNTSSPNIVLPKATPNPQSTANNDSKVIVTNDDVNKPSTTYPNTNPTNNSNQTERPTNTTTNPINTSNNQTNSSTRPKPIQLKLKVLADNTANGWTNAGWVVKKGQKIRISSSGRISLNKEKGIYATPSGLSSLADTDKLMQREATGGLIAVIGDDNNDFVFIGTMREFTATRDGALFLGINEGNLDDNSGAFDVVIEIDPGTSK